MKAIRLLTVMCMIMAMVSSAGAATYKMRVTHQLPDTHHVGKNVTLFKTLVEEKTKGVVEVEIYPTAQAFKPKEVHQAVVIGSVEAGITTNFEWAGMLPVMDLFLVPWLVTDIQVIEKAMNGEVGQQLFKAMEAKGVVPLMWFFQCRTNLYTSNKGPLILPEDFKGKTMRGASKIMNLGSEALGASSMPISGPEVYMALQRGTIDIGLTGIDAALARHYYEIQKYGTVVNNFSVIHPMFINKEFWNSLTDDLKKTIKECASTVQANCIKDSEIARDEAIEELGKKMEIHVQTPKEEFAWKKLMQQPVLDYFLEKTGEDGKRLVELIK